MYAAFKHFHMLMILTSVILFIIQFGLMLAKSDKLNNRFFKIVPHAVNGILIVSGLSLIIITGFIPFTAGAQWLTEKLTSVLAYIALGVFALKLGRTTWIRVLSFFGALGWIVMAATVSISKTPIFLS
jgi:uncharacterized membrane protein SirB2